MPSPTCACTRHSRNIWPHGSAATGLENQLHWVRDVTYDETRSQIRTVTGPQVMATLRNAAIGALRAAGVTKIAAANRTTPATAPALLGIT
jgi:hypothetical protein